MATISLLYLLGIALGLTVNVRILIAFAVASLIALPSGHGALSGNLASAFIISMAGAAAMQVGYFLGMLTQVLGEKR